MIFVGLVSFLLYWIFVVHIFRKWGFDSFQTISDHIAEGDQRQLYNPRAMLLISFFIFYVVAYLMPRYEVGFMAYVFALAAWIGELIVIQLPRRGRHFLVHDRLTLMVGSSLYILVGLIGLSSHANADIHLITYISLFIIALTSVPIIKQKRRKYFLFYQSAFFAGLQIVLLYFGIIK